MGSHIATPGSESMAWHKSGLVNVGDPIGSVKDESTGEQAVKGKDIRKAVRKSERS